MGYKKVITDPWGLTLIILCSCYPECGDQDGEDVALLLRKRDSIGNPTHKTVIAVKLSTIGLSKISQKLS